MSTTSAVKSFVDDTAFAFKAAAGAVGEGGEHSWQLAGIYRHALTSFLVPYLSLRLVLAYHLGQHGGHVTFGISSET